MTNFAELPICRWSKFQQYSSCMITEDRIHRELELLGTVESNYRAFASHGLFKKGFAYLRKESFSKLHPALKSLQNQKSTPDFFSRQGLY